MSTQTKQPSKANTMSIVSKVIAIVCALLFFLGAYITLNTAFHKIPVIDLVMGDEGNPFSDIDTASVDELEAALEKGDFTADEEKSIKKLIDKTRDFIETPSLLNIKEFYNAVLDFGKVATNVSESEYEEFKNDPESQAVMTIFNVIIIIAWVVAFILALFAILSGFRLTKVWAILALVFNILPSLAFVGLWHFVLTTVCLIVLMAVNSMAKRSE